MSGTWSLTLREGHIYRVFENMVLRIFVLQLGEMVEGWGNVRNEELNNWYSSPNITRLMKSMMMRWAGQGGE
jgi:hypothetical protein